MEEINLIDTTGTNDNPPQADPPSISAFAPNEVSQEADSKEADDGSASDQ
jgi:hypothetical protein